MSQFIKRGKVVCERCDDHRKKQGATVHDIGFSLKAALVCVHPDGTKEQMTEGHRYVWRETLFLCNEHLQELREEHTGNDCTLEKYLHSVNACFAEQINTTYEKAVEMGLP